MKFTKTWVAAAAMVALTGAAQAALVSLGDGTVKDTNTNLIWLQNWNVNGQKNWSTQMAWADDLDFAGSTDWHLPDMAQYNALFNAYGDLTNVGAFTDVQSNAYWSATEYAPDPTLARFFDAKFGDTFERVGKERTLFAVAVRPGDVTPAVPEPQSLALVLLALGATVVARRKR